jgi:toxin ParE1/3/4
VKLRYTSRAARHLVNIASHIAAQSPAGAAHIGGRIREVAELLARFPDLGHEGTLAGTREIVVPGLPYVIVHRIESVDTLTVLGVYHGAQLRPGQKPPSD